MVEIVSGVSFGELFSLLTSPLWEVFFMVFTDPPGIEDHQGLEWSLIQRFYELCNL
jgi:hypothetical protein